MCNTREQIVVELLYNVSPGKSCIKPGVHHLDVDLVNRPVLHMHLQSVVFGIPSVAEECQAVDLCLLNDLVRYKLTEKGQVVLQLESVDGASESRFVYYYFVLVHGC